MVDEWFDSAELEDHEGPEDLEGRLGLEGGLIVEEGQVELVDLLAVALLGDHVAVGV